MKQSFAILIFSLLTLLVFEVGGQNDPLLRIEIETKTDNAQYRVVPCGEAGVLLLYPTTLGEDEYQFWMGVFHDKFLQESWKKNLTLFKNMAYRDYILENGALYLFFYNRERKKTDLYNFQLAKITVKDGTYELFSGNLPENARTINFTLLGDNIFAGLNTDKDEAGIYSFNLQNREVKTVFGSSGNKSRLEQVIVNYRHDMLISLFNIYDSKSSFFMQVNTFNSLGDQIGSINIIPEPGRKFNTGRLVWKADSLSYIFGTYEPIKGETADPKSYFSKEASGFFIITIDSKETISTRFENFLDLEKMTGYLRSREFMQAKKKAEKKEDTELASIGYNILLHDVIQRDSLLFLLAEGYFEEYHTVTNTYYDFYGRTIPFSQTIFDGYRHFNAFLSCYDFSGTKLWDNGMEIFNILSFDLRKRVNIHFSDADATLFYNHEGKISSKTITDSQSAEGVSSYAIETPYANDRIMTDTQSDIIPWYGNYFIAYGFQTIRNNALTNSKRTVFYMNKVEFR